MRFMMLMIPKVYQDPEFDALPTLEAMAPMGKYNEALQEAGVLLALDGLRPPSTGARLRFAGGKPTVTDGPFTEAKEVLGGFWIIDVASREEAVAWASRCPAADGDLIEVRQVMETADFPADVQQAIAELERQRQRQAAKGHTS